MKLPSRHQINDEVIMRAIIRGVTFKDGKVFYDLNFIDENNEEDEENSMSGIPNEYIGTYTFIHKANNKTDE